MIINMEKLLSRDDFRMQTLLRNGSICCVTNCEKQAVDAHHILNRNLFTESNEFGGYFLSNGAQLCNDHHYQAELTLISVEELRHYCGIINPVIPENLADDQIYDCWGNLVLDTGFRIAGKLFLDEGCQKALKTAGVLWKFNTY